MVLKRNSFMFIKMLSLEVKTKLSFVIQTQLVFSLLKFKKAVTVHLRPLRTPKISMYIYTHTHV